MNLADYNTTKNQLEALIHSSDMNNCVLACEIFKGVELPVGMKVDIISPIVDAYTAMAAGSASLDTKQGLEKALFLNEKVQLLIDLQIYLYRAA